MMPRISFFISALVAVLIVQELQAADEDGPTAKALQDNSFLIEEAYNQEPGVVQHIGTLQRQGRDWFLAFTQEWPLASQAHQLSYSVPYSWLRSEGIRTDGIGDVKLNYRWQAFTETMHTPAIAPRFSLILPTGSESKGLGEGSFGYELALPISKIVSDRITLHGNLGFRSFFDVNGEQPRALFAGGSIVYAISRELNVLLEGLWEISESVTPNAIIEREKSFTLLPGLRYAFNFPDSAQLVTGFGFPIRFGIGKVDPGIFFYLSMEHQFMK
jgi:hypothetical protein